MCWGQKKKEGIVATAQTSWGCLRPSSCTEAAPRQGLFWEVLFITYTRQMRMTVRAGSRALGVFPKAAHRTPPFHGLPRSRSERPAAESADTACNSCRGFHHPPGFLRVTAPTRGDKTGGLGLFRCTLRLQTVLRSAGCCGSVGAPAALLVLLFTPSRDG